jgi:hypothetical protein
LSDSRLQLELIPYSEVNHCSSEHVRAKKRFAHIERKLFDDVATVTVVDLQQVRADGLVPKVAHKVNFGIGAVKRLEN